jgi:hypothetical protein
MSDQFSLSGSWSTTPLGGSTSLEPVLTTSINESTTIDRKMNVLVVLTVDTAISVAFGSLAGVNIIIVKSDAKVKMKLTSSDGAAQTIPVDSVFLLICESSDITAIDFTREPGIDTNVNVFLAKI